MDDVMFHVKRFLKAKTPEALVVEQVRNNIATGSTHKYDIIYDGKTWYAFFMASAKDLVNIKRVGAGE